MAPFILLLILYICFGIPVSHQIAAKSQELHYKEILRKHTYIFFCLIPTFFLLGSSPQALVLLPSAVSRHVVNMADVFLLKTVMLKLCGSPFPVLICGTFSAVAVFTVSFLWPAGSSCGWAELPSREGNGREGTFLISCLPGGCVRCDSYLAWLLPHTVMIMEEEEEYCLLLC